MFVTEAEVLSSSLRNISLDCSRMQPKTDRPHLQVNPSPPALHLTPSGGHPRGSEENHPNPGLLKPKHEIPATPPPQPDTRQLDFFPKRIG